MALGLRVPLLVEEVELHWEDEGKGEALREVDCVPLVQ